MNECVLRKRLTGLGYDCDETGCVFWAALGQRHEPQCAVQYFKLLDGSEEGLAMWLLGLKDEQLAEILRAGEQQVAE